MSARDTLNPDAMAAKYQVFKDWRNGGTIRPETLSTWSTGRLEDGALIVSAEVRGPNPMDALAEFVDRQIRYLATQGRPGDRMPLLDVSVPGRTSAVWRQGGVWVQLWHDSSSVRRSRRLPFIRNRRKESTAR